MRVLIPFLLLRLNFAFHSLPTFGRIPTSLNEWKVAKDYYIHNPITIEDIDNNDEVLKVGNAHAIYETAKNADYIRSTDELIKENGLPSGNIKYVDEETLLLYLEAYESEGRKNTGLIVVDVREPEEVEKTGQFSPNTVNWPYASKISVDHPFSTFSDDKEWVQKYEFEYPEIFERIIVLGDKETSKIAANYFMLNTYIYEILCYEGGSEEWFEDFPTPDEIEDSAK